MHQSAVDNLFYYLSRVVIFIPLLVIAAALILKYNQPLVKGAKNQIENSVPSPSPTPTVDQFFIAKNSLNIKDNLFCQIPNFQAYVKNKNVFLKYSEKDSERYFLLKGDCFYLWHKEKFNGEKVCGLSPYLSLLDFVSIDSLLENSSLFSLLPAVGIKIDASQAAQLKDLSQACKRQTPEDKWFQLPSNVLFKNKEM
jgi:hypothetical protein